MSNRRDMFKYTGMSASGMAFPETKTMFCVISNKEKPPIQHELMHMVVMLKWGKAHVSSTWMNEGLAALAENNCNGYSVEQIYRYLMEKHLLISMDSLSTSFYGQPEMIAYHQSAYTVQSLIKNHGIRKFKDLWTQGIHSFEQIYGMSFEQVKIDMDKTAKQDFAAVPEINWAEFMKGCN
jgi:hypothetical protein